MNILFIIEAKILELIKQSYRPPPIMHNIIRIFNIVYGTDNIL